MIRAPGATSAIRARGGARPQVQRGRLAHALLPPAAANSARYSSSVAGVPSGRGGVRSCSSRAKNHGSLPAGMKICGWRRSISYSAVVPPLGWPTMKKSGTLSRTAQRAPPARSPGEPRGGAVVGVVRLQEGGRVERRQAAVDDHHHAVADVERGHAVGDDEQRQLVLERRQRLLDQRLGVGSSALVGSSSTSTSGRAASARARQIRCCWPPETASARGPTIVS